MRIRTDLRDVGDSSEPRCARSATMAWSSQLGTAQRGKGTTAAREKGWYRDVEASARNEKLKDTHMSSALCSCMMR